MSKQIQTAKKYGAISVIRKTSIFEMKNKTECKVFNF